MKTQNLVESMALIKGRRSEVWRESGGNAVWEMLCHAWTYLDGQLTEELHKN
jgi:hypothetical protein